MSGPGLTATAPRLRTAQPHWSRGRKPGAIFESVADAILGQSSWSICGCRSFECTVRRLVRRMSLSAPDVRFNADGAYRRDLSNESCQPRVGNSGPTKG